MCTFAIPFDESGEMKEKIIERLKGKYKKQVPNKVIDSRALVSLDKGKGVRVELRII